MKRDTMIKYLAVAAAALLCIGRSGAAGVFSQFNFGADDFNYFADASGAYLPNGDLVEMGYFAAGSSTISALATGGTLSQANYATLLSDFTPLNMTYQLAVNNQGYAASGVVAGTFSGSNVTFNSQAIYVMVFNSSSTGSATQVGVFTGDATWTYFSNMIDPLNTPKTVDTDQASTVPVLGLYVSGLAGSGNAYNADVNGNDPIGALELDVIVPEPSTLLLVGLGLLGVVALRRRS